MLLVAIQLNIALYPMAAKQTFGCQLWMFFAFNKVQIKSNDMFKLKITVSKEKEKTERERMI